MHKLFGGLNKEMMKKSRSSQKMKSGGISPSIEEFDRMMSKVDDKKSSKKSMFKKKNSS